MRARFVMLAAAAVLAGACGGGSSGDDAEAVVDEAAPDEDAESSEPLANAVSIEAAVDVSLAEADFTAVDQPVPVAAGDIVRTDASGFAEVTYFEGSITRLDINTEFTVVELTDDAGGSTVRTDMGVGRTWNRVEELAEGDEFVVETSVATASVRGTAFIVDCPDATTCTFTVIEGVVELTLPDDTTVDVVAPSAVTVTGGVASAPVPVPFDGVFGDPWLADNGDRDATAGFADAVTIYQGHGPAYGSLTGTFTGSRTVTALECVASCLEQSAPVGEVADRSYTFAIDCAGGAPCTGTVDTEYRSNGVDQRQTTPLTFDGTSYTWSVSWQQASCQTDLDGDGTFETLTGSVDTTISWTMRPSAGEARDGSWVVTAIEGSAEANNVVSDVGECGALDYLGDRNVGSITVAR